MSSGELVKAEIAFKDDPTKKVVCMFNPKEYTISKTNDWDVIRVPKKNVGHTVFRGGQPSQLSLKLLFDTHEANKHPQINSTAGDDVRKYTKILWDLMKIDETQSGRDEPPHCVFKWGNAWGFEAVITNISQSFTMFSSNGTPIRSVVEVTFKQVAEEGQYPRQNPTSGGTKGSHLRQVHQGETLAGIAYEEYGTCAGWRHLAETNNIADPRRLRPGQTLMITPMPEMSS
jgi:hypothetical protein